MNAFRKFVGRIKVSLTPDKNTRYFTQRPIHICDHISLSSSYSEKCFRQMLWRKSKHTFCVQIKTHFLCSNQNTLYLFKSKHTLSVQIKTHFICSNQNTLYLFKSKHALSVQIKTRFICSNQNKLYLFKSKHTFSVQIKTHFLCSNQNTLSNVLKVNQSHYRPEMPRGFQELSFPDFMTTAQDGGKVVSLTHQPPLPTGNVPGTHFC